MAGHYQVEDDNHIDVRYMEARISGPGAPVVFPASGSRVTSLKTNITYLDDGFRLARWAYGSLDICL